MSTTLAIARSLVLTRFPFYSALLYGLRYIPTDQIPTLAVTPSLLLFYNPAYLLTLTHEQGEFALWHEVQHVTDSFHLPIEVQKEAVFNIATDLHINCRGRRCGMHPPDGVYFPDKYGYPDDLSSAEYRERLLREPPSPTKGGQQGQGPPPGTGSGRCWAPRSLEEAFADQAPTPVERQITKIKFASDVVRHVKGNNAGDLLEWAQRVLTPSKVPWEKVLSRELRSAVSYDARVGSSDTYNRPNELAFIDPQSQILLPGEEAMIPRVVVIIDTSASMGSRELGIALRETRAVLRSLGLRKIWLLHADTQVAKEEEITIPQLEAGRVQMAGRGGTSFVHALEVASVKHKATTILYVTDGCGTFPPRPPRGAHVLWLYTTDTSKAPFGKTIVVD